MLNQKFDDNKKVIENKSKKNRINEEVDNFNKLIN
jgi:hypothetical protein